MTPLQELKDKFMEAGVLSDWMDDLFDEMIAKDETKCECKNVISIWKAYKCTECGKILEGV